MKDIKTYMTEGIFDFDKNIKTLSPQQLAEVLYKAKYNVDDGSKDSIGQPLKEGDIILVADFNLQNWGVYLGERGSQVEYIAACEDASDPKNIRRVRCNKVVKVDPKYVKFDK